MTTIYTVGHSRHTAEHFAKLLTEQQIATLVDVRSHPASKWAPQFGKAALAQMLGTKAIEYVFLGRELGGRPDGAEFYGADGAVDYPRRAEAPDFKTGIDRVVGLARERATAILCAEEDPVVAIDVCSSHLPFDALASPSSTSEATGVSSPLMGRTPRRHSLASSDASRARTDGTAALPCATPAEPASRLCNSICHRWHAQQPCSPSLLRNRDGLDRHRKKAAGAESVPKLVQVVAELALERLDRFPIYTG
jgi:hypothetical protein